MNCEYLAACPFYNDRMPMDHGIGAIFKKKYCLGNQQICARYLVVNEAGKPLVPDVLYPNMLEMAQQIIEDAKKA
jgi:hypothetical protein